MRRLADPAEIWAADEDDPPRAVPMRHGGGNIFIIPMQRNKI